MLALVFSGIVATYLAYFLIGKYEPALALAISFFVLGISSSFIYPFIGQISRMLPSIVSIDNTAMAVLSLAKLGAGASHGLAFLFIIWQFKAHQVSFVFASSNLISRLIACLAP